MRLSIVFLACIATAFGAAVDSRSLEDFLEDATRAPIDENTDLIVDVPQGNAEGFDGISEENFEEPIDGTELPIERTEAPIDEFKGTAPPIPDAEDEVAENESVEKAPVAAPVEGSVAAPVEGSVAAPVAEPVATPVASPSGKDDATPVVAPKVTPGSAPITTPIAAPVTAPASSPTSKQGGSPVEDSSPVADPAEAPAEVPVKAPVKSPVEAPVRSPVKSPVKAPIATPTYDEPTYNQDYKPPTRRPTVPYTSTDDDPLNKDETTGFEEKLDEWFTNDSTIEEIEHDQTAIIALSAVFGVMFIFAVFVAYQMLENPDGCCASICRITVACWCGILRCVCYPCRAMCGCTGPPAQKYDMPEDGGFTHDLELS